MVMAGIDSVKQAFYAVRPLPSFIEFCYSLPPAEKDARNQVLANDSSGSALRVRDEKEFDEHHETVHNLISSLLTNTTLCQAQQGSTEQVL
jgi:hypothetical protein